MQRFTLSLVVLCYSLVGCGQIGMGYKYFFNPCAGNGPQVSEDFNIVSPDFEIGAFYKSIEQFKEHYQIDEVGRVDYQEQIYPIYRLNLLTPTESTNKPDRPRLLVVGGIHGNESASLLAVLEMLQLHQGKLLQDNKWEVVFLLPTNPVGLVFNSRYNGEGCDINRDFFRLQSVEAQVIKREIERFDPDLVLSPHEGPQEGFFLIATKPSDELLAKNAVAKVKQTGIDLSEKSFLGLKLADNGLWIEGGFVTWFKKTAALGSLGAFMTERGKATFTSESSWSDTDIDARIKAHVLLFESIVTLDLNTRD